MHIKDLIKMLTEAKLEASEPFAATSTSLSVARKRCKRPLALGFTVSYTAVITFAREYTPTITSYSAHGTPLRDRLALCAAHDPRQRLEE